MGRDAGGFNLVPTRHKVVLSEMHLGLDNGEFVA
jgi:hypothetical protein